jgi:HEAT repeat protein
MVLIIYFILLTLTRCSIFAFGEARMRRNFLTFCGLCLIAAVTSFTVYAEPNQPSSTSNQLEDNWSDFLHYTVLGRYDLASGFAQKIIDSNPDPLKLLKLSEDNPKGYAILVKVHASNPQLAPLAAKILDIIEQGRYERRTAADIITEEIKRLSSTVRGKYTAIERLRNSGEYAIPYMLSAMADESRKDEFPNIASALSEIGRPAVRPLTASLEMDNLAVKAEVIRALGKIGYSEALGYLKYIVENDKSDELRGLAAESVKQIDAASAEKKAAELFFQTADNYYYRADSLMPVTEGNTANIWFWNKESNGLVREAVNKTYFPELMSMRTCEWALRADKDFGQAISLWLASFFRIDATHIAYPEYFGKGHADAMTYAVTSGPEYLHEALERAIKDNDTIVAYGSVEALARNAGEKSLMYRYKTSQPLIKALSYNDKAVRYTAAIAIALAEPTEKFPESEYVIKNLASAITDTADGNNWPADKRDSYAVRSGQAMLRLAETRNTAVDVSGALDALVKTTGDSRDEMKIIACQILAYLSSPDAQRAIAELALKEGNSIEIRISGFESLATSAKVNANLLLDNQIDQIYKIVESRDSNEQLRSAAASAFGSLNLPSRRVKDLILDQSRI